MVNIFKILKFTMLIPGFVSSFFKSRFVASSLSHESSSITIDSSKYPLYCEETIMKPKEHGTCLKPVMKNLRWNCDFDVADRICCFNRHYAEFSGYWLTTSFLSEVTLNR
jgi:hypothetical protein